MNHFLVKVHIFVLLRYRKCVYMHTFSLSLSPSLSLFLSLYSEKAPGPGAMMKNSLVRPPSLVGNLALYASFHCLQKSSAVSDVTRLQQDPPKPAPNAELASAPPD